MNLSSACRATATLALAALSACGSEADNDADNRGLQLVLMADAGLPTRYRVVLAKPDSSVVAVSCPGGGEPQFRCTARGVAIESLEAGSTLTIKPSGYEFVSVPVSGNEIAEGRMQVTLAPLAKFEASDAYRTAFDREGGTEAFAALAVETQTEFGPARSVKFYAPGFGESPTVYFQNTRARYTQPVAPRRRERSSHSALSRPARAIRSDTGRILDPSGAALGG